MFESLSAKCLDLDPNSGPVSITFDTWIRIRTRLGCGPGPYTTISTSVTLLSPYVLYILELTPALINVTIDHWSRSHVPMPITSDHFAGLYSGQIKFFVCRCVHECNSMRFTYGYIENEVFFLLLRCARRWARTLQMHMCNCFPRVRMLNLNGICDINHYYHIEEIPIL